ncbi:MAG: FAD:protein FMN transferase [Ruminococcaceae bacterium]|nr:FAD:protein FMN transferase [Oscillospiraceae bacterium]
MKRFFIISIVLCLFATGLCSCATQPQKMKFAAHSMDYFDTATTITGYEYKQEEFDAVSEEILSALGEYYRLYSIYHRFDGMVNLCTINELVDGKHRTVTVDRRIIDMLLYAKEMYNATNGIMNIAMGSVLSLWHDYRTIGKDNPSQASLPPMEKLKEAALHCDIEKMVIDEVNHTVTLTDPLMTLDVGAIAKGYAVECVARSLEEKGVSGYVLNVGGNVRTIGCKADGTPWAVGIENPDGGEYLAYLHLQGEAVVTSGSYQRFYYVDGKPYHHIIHPDTLMPADFYLSVSVVCKDSGLADALSTALFCMSLEEGKALVESFPDAAAMWVAKDGNQTFSSGWNQYAE